MSEGARNVLIVLGLFVVALAVAVLMALTGQEPPTTTVTPTTLPPVTTTTLPSTTVPPTTEAPTTTTTAPVVWPAAVNCRQAGLARWEFHVGTSGDPWWMAQYCLSLPFSEAGWPRDGGDREGYRCGYGMLEGPDAESEVQRWGRVHFTRGADYVGLVDEFFAEGARWYDGSPGPGDGREIGDCPYPRHAYEPLDDVTDERPVVAYVHRELGVLEVRDYRGTGIWNRDGQVVPSPALAEGRVRFQLISVVSEPFTDRGLHPDSVEHTVYSEVVVAAYTQQEDGKWWSAFFVYYSSLHPDVEIQVRFP